jgi:hypothetical protein
MTTPTYQCRRAEVPRQLSAELDVAPWSQAEWITAFGLVPEGESLSEERFMHAALLWDDEALHAAWRSAPSLIPVTKTTRDDDLWTECTVELFLAAGSGYYEFEVNPLGAVLDLHFPDEAEQDWKRCARWDAEGLEWAVRSLGLVSGGLAPWAAQMRIPWEALPLLHREPGAHGDALRGQVSRSCFDAEGVGEAAAWGPVGGAFCERAAMGRLVLSP